METNDKQKNNFELARQRASLSTARGVAGSPLKLAFAPLRKPMPPLFNPLPSARNPKDPVSAELLWPAGNDRDSHISLRALGDMVALYQRHSDRRINDLCRPSAVTPAMMFDMLERARCDVVGADRFPGCAANIREHLSRIAATEPAPVTNHSGLQKYSHAWYFIARDILADEPAPGTYAAITQHLREDVIAATGDPLVWEKLRGLLNSQEEFAQHSNVMLRALGYDTTPPPPDEDDSEIPMEESQTKPPQSEGAGKPAKPKPTSHTEPAKLEPGRGEVKSVTATISIPYKIFTREFDKITSAEHIPFHPADVNYTRMQMDAKLNADRAIMGRLANRLQRRLQTQEESITRYQHDLDAGMLDSTRLSRVIASPANPAAYKNPVETDNRNTIVTLLVDNSGSMRGDALFTAALSTELMAATLERCGIKTEILGFTTRAWKGGRPFEQWKEQGSPKNPGRLSELHHIIYKRADLPMRRARSNMAVMARGDGLIHDNIDGEALEWACTRLMARPEKRRILLVISDGAPQDDGTSYANPGSKILEDHLHQVIARIESEKAIELMAIGIKHDVSRFYKNAITLKNTDELARTLLNQIDRLFPPPGMAQSRRWQKSGPSL